VTILHRCVPVVTHAIIILYILRCCCLLLKNLIIRAKWSGSQFFFFLRDLHDHFLDIAQFVRSNPFNRPIIQLFPFARFMIYGIHKDTMQMPDRTMALSTSVIADSVANPNAINQSQTFVDVEMTISKSLSWKTEVHVLSRAKREISCVIRVVEITAHRLFYPFHGHRQRFLTSAFVTFCDFVIFHRCCIISRYY